MEHCPSRHIHQARRETPVGVTRMVGFHERDAERKGEGGGKGVLVYTDPYGCGLALILVRVIHVRARIYNVYIVYVRIYGMCV